MTALNNIAKLSLALSMGSLTALGTWGLHSEVWASEVDESVVVLASISDEPAKVLRRFQPLADYLAANLADTGIERGEVRVAPDVETLTAWMNAGEIDLYFDSLYPVMAVIDGSGAEPILRRWKDGVESYRAVFFTRQDSGMDSLSDLQGQIIALEEPLSTSAYMLPLAHLHEQGYETMQSVLDESAHPEDEICFVFSGEDQNTIQWVISGHVSAGVTDSGTYAELPEATRQGLTVLAETEALPRQIVVARPSMENEMKWHLISVLQRMDEVEDGQVVLEGFSETSQFDEFPQGADVALGRMREIYDLVVSE